MADYRKTGYVLRQRWMMARRHFEDAIKEGSTIPPPPGPEYDFIRALIQHARGHSRYLINYLRSERPLSACDREQLAQVLEGVLRRKAPRGRPSNDNERGAAFQAIQFYKQWKNENKNAGINDRGHSDAMKSEAVRFVIEEFELPSSPPLKHETVRQLMDRPKSRYQHSHSPKKARSIRRQKSQ